jgi:hypothetical protein
MVHDPSILSWGLRRMFDVITSSALLDGIIVFCSLWLLSVITMSLFSSPATSSLVFICLVILFVGDLSQFGYKNVYNI